MDALNKETTAQMHEVSEDSKIVIRVKDAIAVAAFLVYIGRIN